MTEAQKVCPVCNGTCRMTVPENMQSYKNVIFGYDKETNTTPCKNCGGQYMFGTPTGKVKARLADGTACKHEYYSTTVGNCRNEYKCTHCEDRYLIDSGD